MRLPDKVFGKFTYTVKKLETDGVTAVVSRECGHGRRGARRLAGLTGRMFDAGATGGVGCWSAGLQFLSALEMDKAMAGTARPSPTRLCARRHRARHGAADRCRGRGRAYAPQGRAGHPARSSASSTSLVDYGFKLPQASENAMRVPSAATRARTRTARQDRDPEEMFARGAHRREGGGFTGTPRASRRPSGRSTIR